MHLHVIPIPRAAVAITLIVLLSRGASAEKRIAATRAAVKERTDRFGLRAAVQIDRSKIGTMIYRISNIS